MRSHGFTPKILAIAALCSGSALAQDLTCLSRLAGVEIRGDLNIPGRCELNGTVVRGNVTLFAGGALVARDAHIRGNVAGERADFVDIARSRIDGNVRLEEFVGDRNVIEETEIRGSIRLERHRSRIELLNNELAKGVELSRNTGGVEVSGNQIGGDLNCTRNSPAPVGVGNRVEKRARGQCSALAQSAPPPREEPPPPPTPTPTPSPPASSPPPPSPPPPAAPPAAPPPTTTPTTPRPPTASPPPTSSPPATTTPPQATPPTGATPVPVPPTPSPPVASPAPPTSAPPPTTAPLPSNPIDPDADEGGGGALDWTALALLLPLIARRRRRLGR